MLRILNRISENWCIFAEDKMRFGSIKAGKTLFSRHAVALPFIIFAKDKLHRATRE